MKHVTHFQIIYDTMLKLCSIKRGVTCGEIAAETKLTRSQVEGKIWKLVKDGKVKVMLEKGALNINNNPANIYCITKEVEPKQTELF